MMRHDFRACRIWTGGDGSLVCFNHRPPIGLSKDEENLVWANAPIARHQYLMAEQIAQQRPMLRLWAQVQDRINRFLHPVHCEFLQ